MSGIPSITKTGKVGFLFHLGHGHYTQFLNFQECFPPEHASRPVWVPLLGEGAPDLLARLPLLPRSRRYARNQMWHARKALAGHESWDALFCAAEVTDFRQFMDRYRCYLYTDLTPSLKRELAPWYDHQLHGNPLILAMKNYRRSRLYQACRGIFTMSEWAAQGFQRDYGIPRERLHVVLPGANLNRWPFVDRSSRPIRAGPVRILMVGGQFQLKGGDLMLRWAAETKLRNWEMDIVTWPSELPDWIQEQLGRPGPETRASGSLAPRVANVRVHCGMRANTPEIMKLYEDADIFCLPTQADGSSIASLEAMASGLPVLVGAVGGIPELIDEGRTGFLLKRGSWEDLTAKLERLIDDRDLRLCVGQRARRSCEDFYNVTRQLREIMDVIDSQAETAGTTP